MTLLQMLTRPCGRLLPPSPASAVISFPGMRAQIECAYTVKERFKFRQVADFQSRAVPVGVGPASAFRIIKGFPRRRNMPGLTFFRSKWRGPRPVLRHQTCGHGKAGRGHRRPDVCSGCGLPVEASRGISRHEISHAVCRASSPPARPAMIWLSSRVGPARSSRVTISAAGTRFVRPPRCIAERCEPDRQGG